MPKVRQYRCSTGAVLECIRGVIGFFVEIFLFSTSIFEIKSSLWEDLGKPKITAMIQPACTAQHSKGKSTETQCS